ADGYLGLRQYKRALTYYEPTLRLAKETDHLVHERRGQVNSTVRCYWGSYESFSCLRTNRIQRSDRVGTSTPTNEARMPASPINQQQILELPKRNAYRPRLTLQSALEIADAYIAREKIDISRYYLLEAKYILYGDKDNKDPSWYFWWVNEDGASGHYVEIVVSIKTGNARRLISM